MTQSECCCPVRREPWSVSSGVGVALKFNWQHAGLILSCSCLRKTFEECSLACCVVGTLLEDGIRIVTATTTCPDKMLVPALPIRFASCIVGESSFPCRSRT